MERVHQCLAPNKCSINIHFLHLSLVLIRRLDKISFFGGLPTSACTGHRNATRGEELTYSITAGSLAVFILKILSFLLSHLSYCNLSFLGSFPLNFHSGLPKLGNLFKNFKSREFIFPILPFPRPSIIS